jgi:hypothetical protein
LISRENKYQDSNNHQNGFIEHCYEQYIICIGFKNLRRQVRASISESFLEYFEECGVFSRSGFQFDLKVEHKEWLNTKKNPTLFRQKLPSGPRSALIRGGQPRLYLSKID